MSGWAFILGFAAATLMWAAVIGANDRKAVESGWTAINGTVFVKSLKQPESE